MYTFAAPLDRAERLNPTGRALVFEGLERTYAELAGRCRRLGGALRALGLDKGDRVGMVGPNSDRYLELYLGVPSAGFVFVPVNSRLAPAEITAVLADAGVRVMFMDGDFPVPECVERVIRIPEEYEEFLATGEEIELGEGVVEDDLAALFYTSGTTGLPKGAMHTHRSLISSGLHLMATWPFDVQTRWMIASPLFHTGGTLAVFSTLWHGGQHVLMPSFDARKAVQLIQDEKVTHTLLVPTMLAAATKEQLANPRDVSSLRYLSHGASPISAETLHRARQAFPDAELMHIYGTTETTPITTLLTHEERLLDTHLVGTCGQPAVGVQVRVFDTVTGKECQPSDVGELMVRSSSVMQGYWNKPAETDHAFLDGWYRTGDLGYRDEAANIFLVDRAKDMIVTGGENVYSVEVENALASHAAVDEVAVFGIPDAKWGEAVHAVVVLSQEGITPEELIEHCRARIAGFKVPKSIDVRQAALPKSAAGKILKRDLREPFWAGQAVQVSGS
ncbi:MAG: AMP-binding protein [Kineosporiaceae bacterium]|nr:AMP-binding protein [Kineosporiaceae bacterium]